LGWRTLWSRSLPCSPTIKPFKHLGYPPLSGAISSTGPTIVLAVDQSEELFNEQGRDEAAEFIKMLARTIKDGCNVMAILALRSETFPRFQIDPVLAGITKEPFTLDSMVIGSYQTVIEGPANLIKPVPLKIDPLLTEALLKDISNQDALPLLAFALERLYQAFGSSGQLTFQHYQSLGRMNGVIESAINDAFADGVAARLLPNDRVTQITLAKRAFIPHLVQLSSTGEFVRRIATFDEIPVETRPLVELLVERRLLIKDRRVIDSHEAEVVEVAHEMLLRAWPPLKEALDEEREFLSWLSRVKVQADEYFKLPLGKSHVALLEGFALDLAEEWHRRRPDAIPEKVSRLIQNSSSIAWSVRQHNRIIDALARWAIPGVIGVVVVLVIGLVVWMASYPIMKTIAMNSNTNICFENENGQLVKAIQYLTNSGDPKNANIRRLVERNGIIGKRHHCYELQ
jgi:hypothetical protein